MCRVTDAAWAISQYTSHSSIHESFLNNYKWCNYCDEYLSDWMFEEWKKLEWVHDVVKGVATPRAWWGACDKCDKLVTWPPPFWINVWISLMCDVARVIKCCDGCIDGVELPSLDAESSAIGRDAEVNEVIKGVIIVFKIIFFNALSWLRCLSCLHCLRCLHWLSWLHCLRCLHWLRWLHWQSIWMSWINFCNKWLKKRNHAKFPKNWSQWGAVDSE